MDDTVYCIHCVVTPSVPQNMPETRLTLNIVVAVLLHSYISLYPRLGPAPTITVLTQHFLSSHKVKVTLQDLGFPQH